MVDYNELLHLLECLPNDLFLVLKLLILGLRVLLRFLLLEVRVVGSQSFVLEIEKLDLLLILALCLLSLLGDRV